LAACLLIRDQDSGGRKILLVELGKLNFLINVDKQKCVVMSLQTLAYWAK
jgi:hypothetical protein